MEEVDLRKITIEKIDLASLVGEHPPVSVLRIDTIHPVISGNKWFKLHDYLEDYQKGNYKGIITFGGAWSNHIVATACYCYLKKIKSIGLIRGEKPINLSDALKDAMEYGMELKYLSRSDYRNVSGAGETGTIRQYYPDHYIIPEGGAGELGENGAALIMKYVPPRNFSHIVCAMGTGTMFRGLNKSKEPGLKVFGVPVLKGMDYADVDQDSIFYNYHLGGYAHRNQELIKFMNEFYRITRISSDFVYTGKLFFAVADLLRKKIFPEQSHILVIHSGGLQGNRSLPKGALMF